jgi:hypothetical protein
MPSNDARRIKVRGLTVLLIVVGLGFIALAVYYAVTPASALPSFSPGHQAGSSHHHLKHAGLAAVIGVVIWVGAWFSTVPSKPQRASSISPVEPRDR